MKKTGSRPALAKAVLAGSIALATGTPALAEDYVQFGLGADYSTGDYGFADDTKIFAVPASVRYKSGNFFARGSNVGYRRYNTDDYWRRRHLMSTRYRVWRPR